mmetsp:Transcript_32234/g.52614  ORF Transcript_32234/g.52614 Transcript_32234/m.52614 type:complete len:748 (-) Transcript_32234:54-2297(-)
MGAAGSIHVVHARPRNSFVLSHYTQKCQVGRQSIDAGNVVFVSKEFFQGMKKLLPYEECVPGHVNANELENSSVVLYICHQWYDEGKPDGKDNDVYAMILRFLESEIGQTFSHLWMDYCSVPQTLTSHESIVDHQKKLDNVQTAIFLSDHVLVIPRFEKVELNENPAENEEPSVLPEKGAPTRAASSNREDDANHTKGKSTEKVEGAATEENGPEGVDAGIVVASSEEAPNPENRENAVLLEATPALQALNTEDTERSGSEAQNKKLARRTTSSAPPELEYTDLRALCNRGWCTMELVTALIGQCGLHICFVAGRTSAPWFESVGGGLTPGEQPLLTDDWLGRPESKLPATERSLHPAVDRMVERLLQAAQHGPLRALPEAERAAVTALCRGNWKTVEDPCDRVRELGELMRARRAGRRGELTEVADPARCLSLTLPIHEQNSPGFNVAGVLPEGFSDPADRVRVANMAANVSAFAAGALAGVTHKLDAQLAAWAARHLAEGGRLALEGERVFASDLRRLFDRLAGGPFTQLRLGAACLGPDGARELAAHPVARSGQLLRVEIPGSMVGPAGAVALAGLLAAEGCLVEELDLRGNELGDVGCKLLCDAIKAQTTRLGGPSMTRLDLGNNRLTSASAKQLGLVLRRRAVKLSTLELNHNPELGKEEVAWKDYLGPALKLNGALQELSLEFTGLSQEGRQALREAWKPRPLGIKYDANRRQSVGLEINKQEIVQGRKSLDIRGAEPVGL